MALLIILTSDLDLYLLPQGHLSYYGSKTSLQITLPTSTMRISVFKASVQHFLVNWPRCRALLLCFDTLAYSAKHWTISILLKPAISYPWQSSILFRTSLINGRRSYQTISDYDFVTTNPLHISSAVAHPCYLLHISMHEVSFTGHYYATELEMLHKLLP